MVNSKVEFLGNVTCFGEGVVSQELQVRCVCLYELQISQCQREQLKSKRKINESKKWGLNQKKGMKQILILAEISQKMDANFCISRIRLSLYIVYKCTIISMPFVGQSSLKIKVELSPLTPYKERDSHMDLHLCCPGHRAPSLKKYRFLSSYTTGFQSCLYHLPTISH